MGRLTYKSATGDPPFLVQNECDSSPFDQHSILMKDNFMDVAKIVWNIYIFYFTYTVTGIASGTSKVTVADPEGGGG